MDRNINVIRVLRGASGRDFSLFPAEQRAALA
jgi:hypothetical protein